MSTISYDNYIFKPKSIDIKLTTKKQEQWRKKQIKIFYEEGRPIYGRYINGILVKPDITNTRKLN